MISINLNQIESLKVLIDKYTDIFSDLDIKDLVLKTFNFERPITSIKIIAEDNKKVFQFMRKMEPFFFVSYTHFEFDSKNSRYSILIFISRFRTLVNVVIDYANKYNGKLDEFADLIRLFFGYSSKKIAQYCLEKRPKIIKVSKRNVNQLKEILAEYPDILNYKEKEVPEVIIAKTFTFEKALTGIEIYSLDPERVLQFINDLNKFFYVGYAYAKLEHQETGFTGEVFISRFKNIFDVALDYAKRNNSLSDEIADLSGTLFGIPLKEVAQYCFDKKLYNLVK